MLTRLREKFSGYRRVMMIARKPNKEEFTTTAKVSAAGIIVIGLIGFVIFIGFILGGL